MRRLGGPGEGYRRSKGGGERDMLRPRGGPYPPRGGGERRRKSGEGGPPKRRGGGERLRDMDLRR